MVTIKDSTEAVQQKANKHTLKAFNVAMEKVSFENYCAWKWYALILYKQLTDNINNMYNHHQIVIARLNSIRISLSAMLHCL